MEKSKNGQKKSTILLIIAFSIIFMLLFLIISHYLSHHYYEDTTQPAFNNAIDYKALYNLQSAGKIQPTIYCIDYNLENYTLEYYSNKYVSALDDLEQISRQNLTNEKMEIQKIDFRIYKAPHSYVISSYYFVKKENVIITFLVQYDSKDLYDKYENSITFLITELDIPNKVSTEYDNIFTSMLTCFDILSYEEIAKYKSMLENNDIPNKAYDSLSNTQKKAYDNLYETLFVKKQNCILSPYEFEKFEYEIAFHALEYDLIYLNLDFYNLDFELNFDEITMTSYYLFTANQNTILYLPYYELKEGELCFKVIEFTEEEYVKFNNTVNNIRNNMPTDLSTFGKYKYLADSLCNICVYAQEELEKEDLNDSKNDRIHSMIGLFVDGKAVCDGYAWAYYYLCLKEGLFCNFIDAFPIESEPGHAFNYIKLNEKYYFVDVTWLDENADSCFAFCYDETIENGHNQYIEYWKGIEYTDNSPFDVLINNLGTIDWYNINNN